MTDEMIKKERKMRYESPIEVILGELRLQEENGIYRAVQEAHVNVDKEELLKALRYDREQYEKGYHEAIKEFAEAYKEQIKSYTGMFTDDGFYVPLDAVLRIVEFCKKQMIGEQE